MNIAWVINTAWMASCRSAWRRFESAARTPAEAQENVLRGIVQANRDTQWGCQHGFASIRSPSQFQQRVPITQYADYEQAIERIAARERNILAADPVLLFEPTSGTSTARKLIPYTAALRSEYQRMIGAWIYNLFHHRPRVRSGRAYWSISPALGPRETTPGGIPIGFDNDCDYLGGWQRWLAGRVLAVPQEMANSSDVNTFRFKTLLHLLRCRDLALISIWSPTFLTALLQQLSDPEKLLAELGRFDPRRARDVAAILQSDVPRSAQLARLWPRLAVISCWADATAEPYAAALQRELPKIEIQPKGLLATEGCISFPMCDQPGSALALTSHFLEFAELDMADQSTGVVRLAHELDTGGRYRALLTTGGGLYRYDLGDIVKVVGRFECCPLIRLGGRAGAVSDLVGEKLSQQQVATALARVLPEFDIQRENALVVPVDTRPPRYRLLVVWEGVNLNSLAARLQGELEANPYYRYAVELGQLAPLDVERLPAGESPWQRYEQATIACGQKLGDVKPTSLAIGSPWPASLAGNGHPTRIEPLRHNRPYQHTA